MYQYFFVYQNGENQLIYTETKIKSYNLFKNLIEKKPKSLIKSIVIWWNFKFFTTDDILSVKNLISVSKIRCLSDDCNFSFKFLKCKKF